MKSGYLFFACLCLLTLPSAADESRLKQGEHRVVLDGVNFWYEVIGKGPFMVVQAPGWGIGSSYLRDGFAPLKKDFTLVFYDTRGSGRSGRPSDESRMSTSDMVDDLERLRAYWGLQQINLIGHSHGGEIAGNYASRYPDRVRRLILVDSNISGYWDAALEENVKKASNDPRKKEAAALFLQPGLPKSDEEIAGFFKPLLPLYFVDPKAEAAFARTLNPTQPWVFRKKIESDGKHPLQDTLSRVRARTLILVGQGDFICTVATAEKIHSEVRGSKLVVLPRSGHFPWTETPKEFFNVLKQFIRPES